MVRRERGGDVMPIILLALFGLLTLAMPAFAECAWVIWSNHADGSWAVIGAQGGPDAEALCKQFVTVQEKRRPPSQFVGKLYCFPDTVDPRGPKGTS